MSVSTTPPVVRALLDVLEALELAGITATRDAGAFFPQPVGVIVGLPTLEGRGLASRTYTVPVLVVSADRLDSTLAVDRVYALADDVALALGVDAYRPSSWRSSPSSEEQPAVEVSVTFTVPEMEA